MNKTEFKKEFKRIDISGLKTENPEIADKLTEMYELAAKTDSGIFDKETEVNLDIIFDKLKAGFKKPKAKITVDKQKQLKKQMLKVTRESMAVYKRMKSGDNTAKKEFLKLTRERMKLHKELNSQKYEKGGKLTKDIPHSEIISYALSQIKSGHPQAKVEQNVKHKFNLDTAQAKYFTRRAYIQKIK